VIIAAIFPIFIWFLCYRFRRSAIGITIPFAAGALVMILSPLLKAFLLRSAEPLLPLIYAEAVLITGVGLWLATMPRKKDRDRSCRHCEYDLTGLDINVEGARCPECGGDITPASTHTCVTCSASLHALDLTIPGQRCKKCGTMLPVLRRRRPSEQPPAAPQPAPVSTADQRP
jgi:DNA-directed RNA polymerase subunit RPC12/RpoP